MYISWGPSWLLLFGLTKSRQVRSENPKMTVKNIRNLILLPPFFSFWARKVVRLEDRLAIAWRWRSGKLGLNWFAKEIHMYLPATHKLKRQLVSLSEWDYVCELRTLWVQFASLWQWILSWSHDMFPRHASSTMNSTADRWAMDEFGHSQSWKPRRIATW